MDEFGETPEIFVWPIDHIEGNPIPHDFYTKLGAALKSVGIDWERA